MEQPTSSMPGTAPNNAWIRNTPNPAVQTSTTSDSADLRLVSGVNPPAPPARATAAGPATPARTFAPLAIGIGALAWMTVRAFAGLNPDSGGLMHLLDSAADAPNSPPWGPTVAGGGGAAAGPPGPPDGDGGHGDDDTPEAPDGFEDWMDFSDWATWTTLKNLLPGGLSTPIDVLEMGPETGRTLQKAKHHDDRNRRALETDHRGTDHLTKGDE